MPTKLAARAAHSTISEQTPRKLPSEDASASETSTSLGGAEGVGAAGGDHPERSSGAVHPAGLDTMAVRCDTDGPSRSEDRRRLSETTVLAVGTPISGFFRRSSETFPEQISISSFGFIRRIRTAA